MSKRLLTWCASAPVTVATFIALAGGALLVLEEWLPPTPAMAPAFTLLTINLIAALICKPKLRVNPALLTFHLALLALILLFISARLVYFKGGTLLSEGEMFSGTLVVEERGPLHPGDVETLRFENLGFAREYVENPRPRFTYTKLRWWDSAGQSHTSVIGNDRPLVLDGFRIYATGFRGFSPVFEWHPAGGEPVVGRAQLAESTGSRFAPSTEWQLPNGPNVWVMLDVAPEQPIRPVLLGEQPPAQLEHQLILRSGDSGDERIQLKLGDQIAIEGGTLRYITLSTWLGYSIIYEPFTPWMVATVAIGCLSLIVFYVQTVFRRQKRSSPSLARMNTMGWS